MTTGHSESYEFVQDDFMSQFAVEFKIEVFISIFCIEWTLLCKTYNLFFLKYIFGGKDNFAGGG